VWWLPSGILATVAASWGTLVATDPTTDLAKQGPLGVAVLALAAFARAAYNRERDRADRLEKELTASRDRELAMQAKVAEEFAPMLVRATEELRSRRRQS
jgi:hypothetical protein